MALIVAVIDLKLVVLPKRLEVGLRSLEEVGLSPLSKLDGPFQPTQKRGA